MPRQRWKDLSAPRRFILYILKETQVRKKNWIIEMKRKKIDTKTKYEKHKQQKSSEKYHIRRDRKIIKWLRVSIIK